MILKERNENIVYQKSFQFAVKIVALSKQVMDKGEKILSKQILRAGTSIGANVREALEGQTKKDFIAKLSIALKEAAETDYWLELLLATKYLDEESYSDVKTDLLEIIKILNSIIKTSKSNYVG
jgi:four helix bundle protein